MSAPAPMTRTCRCRQPRSRQPDRPYVMRVPGCGEFRNRQSNVAWFSGRMWLVRRRRRVPPEGNRVLPIALHGALEPNPPNGQSTRSRCRDCASTQPACPFVKPAMKVVGPPCVWRVIIDVAVRLDVKNDVEIRDRDSSGSSGRPSQRRSCHLVWECRCLWSCHGITRTRSGNCRPCPICRSPRRSPSSCRRFHSRSLQRRRLRRQRLAMERAGNQRRRGERER